MFSKRFGGGAKTRTQPSHYSPLPFHLIRLLSFLASLVVSAIMFYFMYHLRHDHFKIPWTFLLVRLPLYPLPYPPTPSNQLTPPNS